MPVQTTAVTTAEVVTTSTIPEVPIDGATAEIPFVPAPQRHTAKPEVNDDAIVVVGQRQKKRKRAKKAGASGDDEKSTSATSTAKVKEEEEVVPFDFANAPNILDDSAADEHSEQEDGRRRKRKKQKKALLGAHDMNLVSSSDGTDFFISPL